MWLPLANTGQSEKRKKMRLHKLNKWRKSQDISTVKSPKSGHLQEQANVPSYRKLYLEILTWGFIQKY